MIKKIHKLIDGGQLKLANSIISQHNGYDSILTPLVDQVFEKGQIKFADYLIHHTVTDIDVGGNNYSIPNIMITDLNNYILYDDFRCGDVHLDERNKWVYQQLYVILNYQKTVGEMSNTLLKCDVEYFNDVSGLNNNIIRHIIDGQVRSKGTEIELFKLTNRLSQKTIRLYFKETEYGYGYHISVNDLNGFLIFLDIMHVSHWYNNHQIIAAFINQINRHT